MAKENKTKYVILGLLSDNPLSGYKIGEIIKESTAYFWQESDASIYPTLKLLTQEKKVTSETVFVGQRKKEVFSITDAGRKEFAEWYIRPAEPDVQRDEFLLKLFFTSPETEEEMNKHFERRLRKLQDLLEEYRSIEKKLNEEFPEKRFWMQTLNNGIAHIELEIKWIKQQKRKGKIS